MQECTVEVFGLDFSIDQGIELINSQTQSVELLLPCIQVWTNVLTQENVTCFLISVDSANAQQQSEILTQILQELSLVIQSEGSSCFEQHLNLVAPVRVLVVAFHKSGVDLPVGVASNGLEQNDDGNEELLFLVQYTQVNVTVSDVMQSESLSVEIVPHTSHLHCEFSVPRASVGVRGSQKCHWIISLLNYQHSHYLLVTVHNEVSSELVGILTFLNQFLLAQPCQVTAVGHHHDRNFP